MTTSPDPDPRWRPRPLVAFALRLASVLVPAAAGAASAYAFAAAVPLPLGPARVPWLLALIAISTVAAAFAERIGRRFLPLAVLFRLSLVFPDRAPTRFSMARGAGNVRRLEQRIRDAREHGLDPEPARAAEQILGLVAALSAHDRKTRGHSERVRAFTDLLADELKLPERDRDRLRWAALLHDVGKLEVPARILNKPGKPEPHEWVTLQGHPSAGARIAAPLLPWLGVWGRAIEEHHERFGGGGYPRGVAGDQISLGGRMVTVADSFEVMTAARSYKKPISVPAARRELAGCAGDQFDPALVRAFLNISLGRLWWRVGPASWTALLPVLGPVQRAGGELVAGVRAGAAALAVGAGSVLSILAGTSVAYGSEGGLRAPATAHHRSSSLTVQAGGSGADAAGNGDHVDAGDDEGSPSGGGDPSDPGDPGDDPVDGVVDDATGAVSDTVGGVSDAVSDTVGGVTDTVDGVVDAGTDVVDGVVDAGTDAVDGLTGGSTGSLDPVVDATTDAVDGAVDGATDAVNDVLGRLG